MRYIIKDNHKRCIKCGSNKVYIGAFQWVGLDSEFIEGDVVLYIECIRCGYRVKANTLYEAWERWDSEN